MQTHRHNASTHELDLTTFDTFILMDHNARTHTHHSVSLLEYMLNGLDLLVFLINIKMDKTSKRNGLIDIAYYTEPHVDTSVSPFPD